MMSRLIAALAVTLIVALLPSAAMAHKLREQGVAVSIADSSLTVTPGRDWNRLDGNVGKHTETWTLDGGQLNDLTFFAGIEPGKPLVLYFGGNAEEKRQKDVAACLTEQRRQRMLVASKAGHYAKLSKQEEMEIMNLCSAFHPPPATPAKN